MSILLSDETLRLIEEQMKSTGCASADELIRAALEALGGTRGEDIEDLDPETQAGLERAEAESARGEGQSWEDVRAVLMAKYVNG
jgi:Arc/MetJ-type ribon-helix-helix transcriptional regulator